MKSSEFCYWLQGLFELGNPQSLDEYQTELIRRHLNMVFLHEIDPSYPKEQQKPLNEAHQGKKPAPPNPTLPIPPIKIQLGGTDEHGNTYRC